MSRPKKVLLTALVLLIIVRLALPYVIRYQINKKLGAMPDYTGHVAGVGLSLIGGSFNLNELHFKDTSDDAVGYFPMIKINWSWGELLHKSFVISLLIREPRVSVILPKAVDALNARAEKAKQEKAAEPRKPAVPVAQQVREQPPFKIDSFEIVNGQIKIEENEMQPPTILWIRKIDMKTVNLTNTPKLANETMLATTDLHFTVNEEAEGKMKLRFNPVAEQPTFDLKAELENLNLPDLNEWTRHQFGLRVDTGTFSMYLEAAAADGAFQGYVKPLITELKVGNPSKEKPLKTLEKAAIQAVTHLLRGSDKNLATKVPIEGRFDNPKTGIVAAVVNVLRNALTNALQPSLEGGVSIKKVQKEAPKLKKK